MKTPLRITVIAALRAFGNNQSELARTVGCTRQYVNRWRRSGIKYVPELFAHRLARMRPELER